MAARMPMIATTIISSIRVKPCWTLFMKTPLRVIRRAHTMVCAPTLYATAVPAGDFRRASHGGGEPCTRAYFDLSHQRLAGSFERPRGKGGGALRKPIQGTLAHCAITTKVTDFVTPCAVGSRESATRRRRRSVPDLGTRARSAGTP